MRVGPQRDLKLMTERQVLQRQIAARSYACKETTNEQEQQDEHASE